MTFKPGDIVKFTWGSKPMTVEAVGVDVGGAYRAYVVWFDKLKDGSWKGPFRVHAYFDELRRVTEKQKDEVRYAIWSDVSGIRKIINRKLYKA